MVISKILKRQKKAFLTAKKIINAYGWRFVFIALINKISNKDLLYGIQPTSNNSISISADLDFLLARKIKPRQIKFPKHKPLVCIGVITYNHKKFIEQCLNSILSQKGDFNLKIVVVDDCSTDNTGEIVNSITKKHKDVIFKQNRINCGSSQTFKKLINFVKKQKPDFWSLIDGDDFYIGENRIQQHLNLHKKYKDVLYSYNKLQVYNEVGEIIEEAFEPEWIKFELDTSELIKFNHIGSLSAPFYSSICLSFLKESTFGEIELADWLFNIYLSRFGKVLLLNEPLSARRIHNGGIFSSMKPVEVANNVINSINVYNNFLEYKYDNEFEIARNPYLFSLNRNNSLPTTEIIVNCDVFPSEKSGFSYNEITWILKKYKKSLSLITGNAYKWIENKSVEYGISQYKVKNQKLADKVWRYDCEKPLKTKMLYSIFLHDAYNYMLPLAKKIKAPFCFELYPGGGFELNSTRSDHQLRVLFNSAYFRKVICTQRITVDYLLKKKLCSKENISFIFGGITAGNSNNHNKYFGEKQMMDIAFVANKYANIIDKGFDVFCEVAKKLSNKYNNINFHVVGNHSADDYDLTGIKNIKFYGRKDVSWLQNFYCSIDIILSPNFKNNGQEIGEFDGFLLDTCILAANQGVAVFATDPLHLNDKHFKNNEDMVIVKHDTSDIINKIDFYYKNPNLLVDLAKKGKNKVAKVYSYNSQMEPRFKIFDECMGGRLKPMKKSFSFILFNIFDFFYTIKLKTKIRTRIINFIKGKNIYA